MKKVLIKLKAFFIGIAVFTVMQFSKKSGAQLLINIFFNVIPTGMTQEDLDFVKKEALSKFMKDRVENKSLKLKQRMRTLTNPETARMFQSDTKELVEEMKQEGLSDSKIIINIRVEWYKVIINNSLSKIKDFASGIVKITIGN